MKIFKSPQIREIDKTTIEQEPVLSINLMERAAWQLHKFIEEKFSKDKPITIFAGPGNNGGDAVALARLLTDNNYNANLWLLKIGKDRSADCQANIKRLEGYSNIQTHELSDNDKFPEIPANHLIVEGIFGSGLTRPAEGWPAEVIEFINTLPNPVMSIDIPSGLFSEDNRQNNGAIIKADYTVSFEFPKLAFVLSENELYVGEWQALSIGLLPKTINDTSTKYYYTTENDLPLLKNRTKFAHKGHFGHALLVAGSFGKTGAAVLAAKACIRSGSGLLSIHIPQFSYSIMQSCVPEAMLVIDETEQIYCQKDHLEPFTVVGAGPGIGQKKSMREALHTLITNTDAPMVLDADALNIISQNHELMDLLPKGSILTPHPKEFDRLTKKHEFHYERIETAREMAEKQKLIVVLKGANTAVIDVNGDVHFNSTGNPAMAKGGSGDVLTGIILGLLSSGYDPIDAARLGVFVHGRAADLALQKESEESLIATDIINHLGLAYKSIRELQ
ncbi:Nicotinamide nucleotide repair protein [Salinivirga cyanobacteriivorans]|uniref:Bifunctional NAD(P)H-hydrate repair enzyme n=1 Tax=Salinivirga cyanobacteriivorans TaxID=1307839 RepID=A0A0S2I1K8_9BACT|nr:bifunctional ADP-dependent NAD(P)H-hydrate dehydratase/NAD(P)H-hydrate epimerase [Salinivirga cyanobacteriivorans]ALO16158.1 Nicotinamide nucleotide repair protein [Salinivirga cyanobacteriivorans]